MLEHVLARGERQRKIVEDENKRVLTLRGATEQPVDAAQTTTHRAEPAVRDERAPDDGHEETSRPPAFLLINNAAPAPLDLAAEDTRQFTLGEGANAAKVQVWRRGDSYLLQQISGAPISIGGQVLTAPVVVLEDGDEIAHAGDVMRIVLGARE
jgi:hypothetical protein